MTFSCASARLYLCTDARSGPEDLRSFVRACFAGGVDIVQVRDKTIEARDELAALAVVAEEARAAGRWVAANDRADVARLAGTDVLHVGQRDLRPEDAARVAPNAVIGMSTHTPEQMLAAANHPHVDYFCTGPIWATPTKPGRQAVGLDLVREAARLEADRATTGSPLKPWFAIGGVGEHTLDEALEAGATRIVVVRALTQADNPKAAARRLRSRLEQAR